MSLLGIVDGHFTTLLLWVSFTVTAWYHSIFLMTECHNVAAEPHLKPLNGASFISLDIAAERFRTMGACLANVKVSLKPFEPRDLHH